MFQLLVHVGKHDLAVRQLPAFIISFTLASLFYRFGSFALECLAFLATWFVVDATFQLVAGVRHRWGSRSSQPGLDGEA
jgi:hypothetical protein